MANTKVGIFLLEKRVALGLSVAQMAERVGCNRTTIQRNEQGLRMMHRCKVIKCAEAYECDPKELAELCGYKNFSAKQAVSRTSVDLQEITASVDDLEYLLTVARGLQKPLTLATIRELLKCRKA